MRRERVGVGEREKEERRRGERKEKVEGMETRKMYIPIVSVASFFTCSLNFPATPMAAAAIKWGCLVGASGKLKPCFINLLLLVFEN